MSFTLSFREGFLAEALALGAKEQSQVFAKLQMLLSDPHPDGSTKKQLKHLDRKVYRLRSGDFRIFYSFDDKFVSLLKVVRRSEGTYDDVVDEEHFGGPSEEALTPPKPRRRDYSAAPSQPQQVSPALPTPITEELLARLKVPAQFHSKLQTIKDEDALLGTAGIPDDVLLRVHSALFERPIETALEEKELIAGTVDELLRYRDGDLLGFLLRLSAEQEKFVSWALEGGGPTLVKGGPGTGKSTVALYRVKAMLEALRRSGVSQPRILFTTYTNALISFSEQLLRSLLGDDAEYVEVKTADSVALSVVSARSGKQRIASQPEVRDALQKALAALKPAGDSLARRAQLDLLTRLGTDYLLEEIGSVIEARGLKTFEAYRDANRPGRRVGFNEAQRTLIWTLRDGFNKELKRLGKVRLQQMEGILRQVLC